MGQIFAAQNEIGRLADEQVYRADVAHRLASTGLETFEKVLLTLRHKDFVKTLYLDLVIDRKAVYELKTVAALVPNHVSQLMTYLNLLDLPRGKLVNFRSTPVESEYVNTPLTNDERCSFDVSSENYAGDPGFLKMVVDLLSDWGTGLSVSLYRQALVHMLGGDDIVERMMPLVRQGHPLPSQRFHLVDEATAFEITTFPKMEEGYATQLNRLLQLSPLKKLHWVNISHGQLTFSTIPKP